MFLSSPKPSTLFSSLKSFSRSAKQAPEEAANCMARKPYGTVVRGLAGAEGGVRTFLIVHDGAFFVSIYQDELPTWR